jgi:hypothetical protein
VNNTRILHHHPHFVESAHNCTCSNVFCFLFFVLIARDIRFAFLASVKLSYFCSFFKKKKKKERKKESFL